MSLGRVCETGIVISIGCTQYLLLFSRCTLKLEEAAEIKTAMMDREGWRDS